MEKANSISRRSVLGGLLAAGAGALLRPSLGLAAAEPAKSPWQIGCFTRPWRDEPYAVAFDAIAEAGFKYVGFMTSKVPGSYFLTAKTTPEDAAKAGEEARKRGLGVLAAWGGGLPLKTGVAEGVEALRKLIDNAAIAKVGTLLMGGTGNEKEYDAYYKAIAECADYAGEKNVALVIKPHGGLNSTSEQCRKTIEKVGKKNFRYWFDPGNIYYYSDGKLDPIEDAKAAAGVVTGMCVKDFKGPKSVDVTPGSGEVKFKEVMAVLKAGGFTGGPLVVETLGPVEGAKERIVEARKARELVERIIA
jgi:sugar phosphate isomerase/epimerase